MNGSLRCTTDRCTALKSCDLVLQNPAALASIFYLDKRIICGSGDREPRNDVASLDFNLDIFGASWFFNAPGDRASRSEVTVNSSRRARVEKGTSINP